MSSFGRSSGVYQRHASSLSSAKKAFRGNYSFFSRYQCTTKPFNPWCSMCCWISSRPLCAQRRMNRLVDLSQKWVSLSGWASFWVCVSSKSLFAAPEKREVNGDMNEIRLGNDYYPSRSKRRHFIFWRLLIFKAVPFFWRKENSRLKSYASYVCLSIQFHSTNLYSLPWRGSLRTMLASISKEEPKFPKGSPSLKPHFQTFSWDLSVKFPLL